MNVPIKIDYTGSSKISQSASFPLRGKKKPERVALEWWRQIKKEMNYHVKLEKVLVADNQDITQLVKDIEKEEWEKAMNDNLPF